MGLDFKGNGSYHGMSEQWERSDRIYRLECLGKSIAEKLPKPVLSIVIVVAGVAMGILLLSNQKVVGDNLPVKGEPQNTSEMRK